jgi:hypothetical protein
VRGGGDPTTRWVSEGVVENDSIAWRCETCGRRIKLPATVAPPRSSGCACYGSAVSAAPASVKRPEWVRCAWSGLDYEPWKEDRRTWCGRVPPQGERCFMHASHAALSGRDGPLVDRTGKIADVLCPACCVNIVRALWRGLPSGVADRASRAEVDLRVKMLVDDLRSRDSARYEEYRAFLIQKYGHEEFCRLQDLAFASQLEALLRSQVEPDTAEKSYSMPVEALALLCMLVREGRNAFHLADQVSNMTNVAFLVVAKFAEYVRGDDGVVSVRILAPGIEIAESIARGAGLQVQP